MQFVASQANPWISAQAAPKCSPEIEPRRKQLLNVEKYESTRSVQVTRAN